jgi:predicted DsbA family dithiol-disulfide isomerase
VAHRVFDRFDLAAAVAGEDEFASGGSVPAGWRSSTAPQKPTPRPPAGGPEFILQQGAAPAAGRQDKLWNFIDVFDRDQGPEHTGYVDEKFLHLIAVQAGIDLESWEGARGASLRWIHSLDVDEAPARRTRVVSTPSFLIGPTGGPSRVLRHFGLEETAVFDAAVEEALRQSRRAPTAGA